VVAYFFHKGVADLQSVLAENLQTEIATKMALCDIIAPVGTISRIT